MRVPADQDDTDELDVDDSTLIDSARDGDSLVLPVTGRILTAWAATPEHGDSDDDGGDAPEEGIEIRKLLIGVFGADCDLGPARPGVADNVTARLADELFKHLNRWHDTFRSWIETFTFQDLDHDHPRWTAHVEGSGLATFDDGGTRLGHGGILRLDSIWPTPASRDVVELALTKACADEPPPLAHLMLRDARAAYDRGQMRKAILDAATATELSLTRIADECGVTPRRPTLGSLIAALDEAGRLADGVADKFRTLVLRPRNNAIHDGTITLSGWDTAEACKAAQKAVWHAFPL